MGSEASIKKSHDVLKQKYKSGELTVWNKGKIGVQTSPRKGKTGKDFPFLCASKKGKSGGWNRGITVDDPRYASLKHTEEQSRKSSEIMKERSKNHLNDNFIYSGKDTIFINNGEMSKRIKKDEPIPEGWQKGRLSHGKRK